MTEKLAELFEEDGGPVPIARVDREGRVVDRGAVGDHHQDAALLGPAEQALVCAT
jgi:hypothetical protein